MGQKNNMTFPIGKQTNIYYFYFNRLWYCPEGGSSNSGPGSGVHCGPPVRVDRGSNAIPVHPIIAGSAKLPD